MKQGIEPVACIIYTVEPRLSDPLYYSAWVKMVVSLNAHAQLIAYHGNMYV